MVEWHFNSSNEMDAHRLRREFMSYLRASGMGDYDAAELVCGELVGNAVRYAPGSITVRAEWDRECLALTVHDEHDAFVPRAVLPSDPLAEHGRGLYIVKTLALDFCVQDMPNDGTAVRVRLPVYRVA